MPLRGAFDKPKKPPQPPPKPAADKLKKGQAKDKQKQGVNNGNN